MRQVKNEWRFSFPEARQERARGLKSTVEVTADHDRSDADDGGGMSSWRRGIPAMQPEPGSCFDMALDESEVRYFFFVFEMSASSLCSPEPLRARISKMRISRCASTCFGLICVTRVKSRNAAAALPSRLWTTPR